VSNLNEKHVISLLYHIIIPLISIPISFYFQPIIHISILSITISFYFLPIIHISIPSIPIIIPIYNPF